MNAGFGASLVGMSLGAGALGGMLGIAGGMFVVLAATTFAAGLLYAVSVSALPSSQHRSFCCFSTRDGQFSS